MVHIQILFLIASYLYKVNLNTYFFNNENVSLRNLNNYSDIGNINIKTKYIHTFIDSEEFHRPITDEGNGAQKI